MGEDNGIRPGELAVQAPEPADARLAFIGVIRTPWTDRSMCPRQGRPDGPACVVEVFAPWTAALDGVEACERLELLYWLHQSRRDLVLQRPRSHGEPKGSFALRSPVRPNPIGTSIVTLLRREGPLLHVRGLDYLDGTPLLDIKPERRSLVQPAGASQTS